MFIFSIAPTNGAVENTKFKYLDACETTGKTKVCNNCAVEDLVQKCFDVY